MRSAGWIGVGCCVALLTGAALAAPGMTEGGSYEVEVRLELPHVEASAARKVARLCLDAGPSVGDHGLAVLSDNNPLAKCPAANVRRDGDELTFDIACGGRNAAWGIARYTLAPTGFRGRINMWMGGKNMTMTEVQTGHRTGACLDQDGRKVPAL